MSIQAHICSCKLISIRLCSYKLIDAHIGLFMFTQALDAHVCSYMLIAAHICSYSYEFIQTHIGSYELIYGIAAHIGALTS